MEPKDYKGAQGILEERIKSLCGQSGGRMSFIGCFKDPNNPNPGHGIIKLRYTKDNSQIEIPFWLDQKLSVVIDKALIALLDKTEKYFVGIGREVMRQEFRQFIGVE